MSVPWTAYRDQSADTEMQNNKITGGALPEIMPQPKWQMGAGNMGPDFGYMPQSQREAAMHRGMKGQEYSENGNYKDVTSYGDNKQDDKQAKEMMNTNPPVGTENYQGQSTEKDY